MKFKFLQNAKVVNKDFVEFYGSKVSNVTVVDFNKVEIHEVQASYDFSPMPPPITKIEYTIELDSGKRIKVHEEDLEEIKDVPF